MVIYGPKLTEHLKKQLSEIQAQGLYKVEREIASSQSSHIRLANGKEVINFCANNYLGLANNPLLIESAKKLRYLGFWALPPVRFICGTQSIHHQLEAKISNFYKLKAPFCTLLL